MMLCACERQTSRKTDRKEDRKGAREGRNEAAERERADTETQLPIVELHCTVYKGP